MRNILIPTSKLIKKDLRDIYGDIPSVLIPVNSYETLLEQISNSNKDKKIYLLSHEGKEIINAVIKNKRLDNVINIEIENANSLKDTILKIEHILSGEVTLLFGDTTTKRSSFDNYFGGNFISYSELYLSETNKERWTYFSIDNGFEILNPENLIINNEYKFINGIFNFLSFEYFLTCLKTEESFFSAITKYNLKYSFKYINEVNWLDFGDLVNQSKNKIIEPREFNQIKISKDRKYITKRSTMLNKFIDEIKWMTGLPNELKKYIPKIKSYSIEGDNSYLTMEFVNHPTVSEIFMNSNLDKKYWTSILKSLIQVKIEFSRYEILNHDFDKYLNDMYFKKTIERLEDINDDIKDILYKDELLINGIKFKGINYIMNNISYYVSKYLLDIRKFNLIHGDFFFANILLINDKNKELKIKLIDPRGSFSAKDNNMSEDESIFYGDERYDYAKLSHSVRGKYDVIINDLFIINRFDEKIYYEFTNTNNTKMVEEILRSLINSYTNYSYDKEILLIESLLFLSMASLHQEKPNRQKMMLITGIELFNKFLKENEDDWEE